MTLRKFLKVEFPELETLPVEINKYLNRQILKLRVNEVAHISDAIEFDMPTMVECMLMRRCRECGCTDNNCSQCIEKIGSACRWVDEDLCSACV
jgi:hypothetical protein